MADPDRGSGGAGGKGEPVEVEPWWADTSGLVANGPYQVSSETDDALTLTASETYSGTQSGPAELTFPLRRYARRKPRACMKIRKWTSCPG